MTRRRAAAPPGAGHRAKKRLGQHFLHDPGVLARIVAAIDPQPDDRLVEIGPGLGALTVPLLARVRRLVAVELDRDAIPRLLERCAGAVAAGAELTVHQGDALRFDFAALADDGVPLRICGNLPYNVSTPLLFHLLEQRHAIRDMHFMLQREVVERMAAAPGSDAYGRLTVMLAAHARVEKLFRVGPGAFRPPPRVESAVVRVVPHAQPPFAIPDPVRFVELVRQAFTRRRKTLRNALAGLVDETAMRAAGIDPQARPETLSAEQFARLT
jgi:16S rRNA (adenine1518-N6/adenine1519-N6)-dimethyltransferase